MDIVRTLADRTIKPRTATIRYTILTPPDNSIGDGDAAEVELPEKVRSTVQYGWAREW